MNAPQPNCPILVTRMVPVSFTPMMQSLVHRMCVAGVPPNAIAWFVFQLLIGTLSGGGGGAAQVPQSILDDMMDRLISGNLEAFKQKLVECAQEDPLWREWLQFRDDLQALIRDLTPSELACAFNDYFHNGQTYPQAAAAEIHRSRRPRPKGLS